MHPKLKELLKNYIKEILAIYRHGEEPSDEELERILLELDLEVKRSDKDRTRRPI